MYPLYFLLTFLLGFVVALAVTGRVPLRYLRPVGRIVILPFRPLGRLLRRVGIFRTRTTHTAAEGATIVERGLYFRTEVDAALRSTADVGENGTPIPYDFKEENRILRRFGWLFKSIRIPAAYLPSHLIGQLTGEIAQFYEAEARKFFAVPVALRANRQSLYEDAEGAFIISLFRSVDRRCYYVLNEMRKTINGNARNLAVVFTAILMAWTFCSLLGFAFMRGSIEVVPNVVMGISMASAAFLTVVLMAFLQNTGYKQQQQHNSRELRLFLIQYLGRIADRYREATGNAKQVTVGDEVDSKKLSQAAQQWHKIMVWIPFRTFYIECFMRSVRYQIDRNCGYYLLIPYSAAPLLAAVALPILYWMLPAWDFSNVAPLTNAAVFVLSLTILNYFYFERIRAVVIGEELTHLDWLGYDNLNVSSAMDEVVGKYAEDVGFWKGRMKF